MVENVPEISKSIKISLGLIALMIFMTFWVTTFYHNQTTIESRMNKRYERTMETLKAMEEDHVEMDKRVRHLEDNCK